MTRGATPTQAQSGEADKECIFCGSSGPFNEEHPFGQWTWRYIADPEAEYTIVHGVRDYGNRSLGNREPSNDRRTEKFGNKGMNVWTRNICKECNGGWIKTLDEQCEPFLSRMFGGENEKLDRDQRTLFARWATKSAMGRDSKDLPSSRVVPASACREFYMAQRPPAQFLIWTGRYIGKFAHRYWAHRLFPIVRPGMDASAPAGFSLTFTLGNILVQLVRVRENEDVPDAMQVARRFPVLEVWPSIDDELAWPPFTVVMDNVIESFAFAHVFAALQDD